MFRRQQIESSHLLWWNLANNTTLCDGFSSRLRFIVLYFPCSFSTTYTMKFRTIRRISQRRKFLAAYGVATVHDKLGTCRRRRRQVTYGSVGDKSQITGIPLTRANQLPLARLYCDADYESDSSNQVCNNVIPKKCKNINGSIETYSAADRCFNTDTRFIYF